MKPVPLQVEAERQVQASHLQEYLYVAQCRVDDMPAVGCRVRHQAGCTTEAVQQAAHQALSRRVQGMHMLSEQHGHSRGDATWAALLSRALLLAALLQLAAGALSSSAAAAALETPARANGPDAGPQLAMPLHQLSALLPDSSNDFEVEGVQFRNRSLGLGARFWQLGHQCSPRSEELKALQSHVGAHRGGRRRAATEGGDRDARMLRYTPNRLWPSSSKAGRTALVMAVGGPIERFTQRMQVGWQGLLNNFLARMASSTSLVLLLDADYPSSLEGIAADLGLARVDCVVHAAACEAAAAIDDGYRLFMAWPTTGAAPHVRQPVMVLLSKAVFPAPLWVQRNGSAEGDIAAAWRTPHCAATPYLTTKFLNWYAHGMFTQLRVLDYFDFWMKLDDDVRWAQPFPGDITHHLITKHHTLVHSGLRQERNLDCIGRERLSASKVARLYLDTESSLCRKVLAARSSHHAWFDNDTEVFTSELAVGWLGFFTAPEVLLFGAMWSNYPGGIWEYRWGDHHFWKTAVGLFDDGTHIEDVSYIRVAPATPTYYNDSNDFTGVKHFLGLMHHD